MEFVLIGAGGDGGEAADGDESGSGEIVRRLREEGGPDEPLTEGDWR